MRFAYYARLSAAKQRVYRASDALRDVPLADPSKIKPFVTQLDAALATGKQRAVQLASQQLVDAMTRSFAIEHVAVTVHRQRPRNDGGELYGYYQRDEINTPTIDLWMRTAANANIVAFRTYLRTLFHEVCHHLDFTLFGLTETFHTHGFLRRESSLMRQLHGPTRRAKTPVNAHAEKPAAPTRNPRVRAAQPDVREQLTLKLG